MLKRLMATLAGVAVATSLVVSGQEVKAESCYDKFTMYNGSDSDIPVSIYRDANFVEARLLKSNSEENFELAGCGNWYMIYDQLTDSRTRDVFVALNGFQDSLVFGDFGNTGVISYAIFYEAP